MHIDKMFNFNIYYTDVACQYIKFAINRLLLFEVLHSNRFYVNVQWMNIYEFRLSVQEVNFLFVSPFPFFLSKSMNMKIPIHHL